MCLIVLFSLEQTWNVTPDQVLRVHEHLLKNANT